MSASETPDMRTPSTDPADVRKTGPENDTSGLPLTIGAVTYERDAEGDWWYVLGGLPSLVAPEHRETLDALADERRVVARLAAELERLVLATRHAARDAFVEGACWAENEGAWRLADAERAAREEYPDA